MPPSTLIVMGRAMFGGVIMTVVVAACDGSAAGPGGTSGVSPGKASIEFTVAGPDAYCMTSECGDGPSIGIEDSSGKSLTLRTSCSQIPCETCQQLGCPGYACQPRGIAVTGVKMEWDGTLYVPSTCGASVSCTRHTYASPGKYTATMCATPGTLTGADGGEPQCVTSGPAECASIEFDLPSDAIAKGTIGP